MKNKLNKRIKATKNLNWSKYLIKVILAINNPGYSSFFYNITLYKVFFSLKYYNYANNLTII